MTITTQTIREGLQYAPTALRKSAVPALDQVEALLWELVEAKPTAELAQKASALLGRE